MNPGQDQSLDLNCSRCGGSITAYTRDEAANYVVGCCDVAVRGYSLPRAQKLWEEINREDSRRGELVAAGDIGELDLKYSIVIQFDDVESVREAINKRCAKWV